MIAMVTAATVISYVIYCGQLAVGRVQDAGDRPLGLYGVFRYLYLIYDRKDTRSTDAILLEDKGMIGAAVVWVALGDRAAGAVQVCRSDAVVSAPCRRCLFGWLGAERR